MRRRGGFSLLELTLVLVILGILGAVAAVNVLGQSERARVQATKTDMQVIANAIEAYMAQEGRGRPPATLEVLREGSQAYLQATVTFTDAWGTPYFYRSESNEPGRPFILISYGPDGEGGTADDIDIWVVKSGG
mgnify:CR=1 FL=1